MRFWVPNKVVLGWFLICVAGGAFFFVYLAAAGRYRDMAVVLLWTAGAGAMAISEWRALS